MRVPRDVPGRWLIVLALLAFGHYGCGGGSDSTGPDPQTVTVSLTAPADGDTLSGAVQIAASAENADSVTFSVDGVDVGSDDSSPYGVSWNTGTVANGARSLRARAEGGGGSAED